MGLTVKEAKGGRLKVTRAGTRKTGNTLEERKELDRLRLLELRKLGDERKLENEQWFEEKYKGEKVAGPDAFKSAMGLKWDYSLPATPAMREMGVEKVKLYAPKNLEDLERLRKPALLNWGGMSERFRQAFTEGSKIGGFEDESPYGLGSLKDRNRATGLSKNLLPHENIPSEGLTIERYPQFDVRGWRFDASQHYGGQTTENLPWADMESLDKVDSKGNTRHDSWSKYVRPFYEDDGKTMGLMWINPRIPKGLTAERVIDDFMAEAGGGDYRSLSENVIGESSRLAMGVDQRWPRSGSSGFGEANLKAGEAYRKEASELLGGKVPSGGDTLPKPMQRPAGSAGKAMGLELGGFGPIREKMTFLYNAESAKLSPLQLKHIEKAEEEERKLMEEPLKKDKK